MSDTSQSDLVLRLAEMAGELRGLIEEGHGMIKDLNRAVAEAKTVAREEVAAKVQAEVARQLEEMGEAVKKQMGASVAKVQAEFEKLEQLMFTGGTGGRSGPDLRQMAARMQPPRCLKCGEKLDAAKLVTGNSSPDAFGLETHDEGAISLCGYCGNIAIFTGNGHELRPATKAEKDEVMRDPTLKKIRTALRGKRLPPRGRR